MYYLIGTSIIVWKRRHSERSVIHLGQASNQTCWGVQYFLQLCLFAWLLHLLELQEVGIICWIFLTWKISRHCTQYKSKMHNSVSISLPAWRFWWLSAFSTCLQQFALGLYVRLSMLLFMHHMRKIKVAFKLKFSES